MLTVLAAMGTAVVAVSTTAEWVKRRWGVRPGARVADHEEMDSRKWTLLVLALATVACGVMAAGWLS
jgi:hypothetical protein